MRTTQSMVDGAGRQRLRRQKGIHLDNDRIARLLRELGVFAGGDSYSHDHGRFVSVLATTTGSRQAEVSGRVAEPGGVSTVPFSGCRRASITFED